MLKARECGLRQVYALRASMYAHAGNMAEANKAYAAWKKTTCSNAIDDMDIFDYLQISHHYDEALGFIVRYREFISEQGDTISYRMLSALNREALLRVEMGDYEQAAAYGRQVAIVAHQLHIIKSGEQMQTTYNLLQEQSASESKTKWLMLSGIAILIAAVVTLIILYYVRNERRHFRDIRKLAHVLEAYRRAVINGEPSTSPEVVAAIEELRSIQLPDSQPSDGEEEPDDEDHRLFVEMDTQVTRDRLFLKPGLGREDLMRLIGVDKNRFGKMMSKYSDASNTSVYINQKRVEYGAKLLLEHPEYTISTVATECGMSNTVTFNRTFKEMYNMTPSEYREKMASI
jgi:AraC-like DNA-binding protein